MEKGIHSENLGFFPLTPKRWQDFVDLMGPKGACAGCWCMYWRLTRKEFQNSCGEANKLAMKKLVDTGVIPGIIGYQAGTPTVWCSIAPREQFSALERSRLLKRMDQRQVWSIVCFFIAKAQRRSGLLREAITSAVEYARQQGATLVEAYPVKNLSKQSAVSLYMGTLNSFISAGFSIIEERRNHALVRFEIS